MDMLLIGHNLISHEDTNTSSHADDLNNIHEDINSINSHKENTWSNWSSLVHHENDNTGGGSRRLFGFIPPEDDTPQFSSNSGSDSVGLLDTLGSLSHNNIGNLGGTFDILNTNHNQGYIGGGIDFTDTHSDFISNIIDTTHENIPPIDLSHVDLSDLDTSHIDTDTSHLTKPHDKISDGYARQAAWHFGGVFDHIIEPIESHFDDNTDKEYIMSELTVRKTNAIKTLEEYPYMCLI
eukprot:GHVR01102092.1.p1 GENE.GHVR01102092.1~~GHVR01102092.1.p1  ORF type:complete len:237 (+),score=65.15 GHVR01102092.1:255-965(+)